MKAGDNGIVRQGLPASLHRRDAWAI